MTIEEIQLDLVKHTAAGQKLITACQVRATKNLEVQAEAEMQKSVYEMEAMKESLERASKQTLVFMRPCMTFRPALIREGDHWVAIYGELRATGPTPETAHQEFDRIWVGKDEL